MDRALATARKIVESINYSLTSNGVVNDDADGSGADLLTHELAAFIQSAMNAHDKERLGTDWQELAKKNQETADKALALVDAMNAQERELRRAYELAHIFAKKIAMLALSEKSYDEYSSALKELAEAERLLAESGETK